ncbi:CinA family protein [Butyrivibrio sp. CB08]|uniref:CinA family protein n=1 Tax=Butyrivibrio sp. CB08 TaxID=2364879 RepID=UPI000EA8F3F1|nr:CinA family protein [Butyrivibrio sp. CB08]RKM62058.1 CinA family protein [Butyrivibrio sp. CB08]
MGKETSAKFTEITKTLIEKKLTITTMESCTAGLVASLLTDTEGSSEVMKGAFITYSNEAKIKQGVPAEIIAGYGVYSEETAYAMAVSAKRAYGADISVGVTGTMGNADPANKDSVPGEVFFAIVYKDSYFSFHENIPSQPTRYDYKLYVADLIADEIMRVIQ